MTPSYCDTALGDKHMCERTKRNSEPLAGGARARAMLLRIADPTRSEDWK